MIVSGIADLSERKNVFYFREFKLPNSAEAVTFGRLHDEINHAQRSGNPRAEADLIYTLGQTYIERGHYREAQFSFAIGFQKARELDDKKRLHKFYCRLGEAAYCRSDFAKALIYLFKVLEYDDSELNADAFSTLSQIYQYEEDYLRSHNYLREAFQENYSKGNYIGMAQNLTNLGHLSREERRYALAIKFYSHALQILATSRHPHPPTKSNAIIGAGSATMDLRRLEEAGELFHYGLYISEKYQLSEKRAVCLQKMGQVAGLSNDLEAANKFFHDALQISNSYGFEELKVSVLGNIERTEIALKHFDIAESVKESRSRLAILKLLEDRDRNLASWIIERETELEFLREKNRALLSQTNDLKLYGSVLAHDLREPLRNIASFANLINRKHKEKMDPEALEFLDFITENTDIMDALLRDLMTYFTTNCNASEFTQVNISQVIRDAINALPEDLSGLAEFDIGEMPVLAGIQNKLTEAFSHLISNAVKFRGEKKPLIKIRCKENEEGNFLFSISDNGIGINPEYHQKIFSLFHKLDKKEFKGTGLGLALAKKIIQQHGGNIWLDSIPGEGSTFFFDIRRF